MSDLTLEQQQSAARCEKIFNTACIVANVIELTTSVVQQVAGKDVADSVKGETLSRGVLTSLVASRLKDRLLQRGGN